MTRKSNSKSTFSAEEFQEFYQYALVPCQNSDDAYDLLQTGFEKYLNELKSVISSNKMDEHFTFIGQRGDMKEVMSVSDIVLSLAITPEAFGRTALEALCLGVPVIAYDHGGAKEVLAEMFPEGKAIPLDSDSVVSIINTFYQSMPIVKNRNTFTLNTMLDKTISIYNSFA